MRVIFAEARAVDKIKIRKGEVDKLPKKVGLLTTVQLIGQVKDVRRKIEDSGRVVILGRGEHSKYDGQILGCDAVPPKDVEAYLYVGEGLFHPLGIALKTDKPVFILDPTTGRLSRLNSELVEKEKKRKKGALLRFLDAKSVGILVSTKPGQLRLEQAFSLKKQLKSLGKDAYVLIFDTLDPSELGNFTFIECFVNLACPRISEDAEKLGRPVVNYEDILSYLKYK
ncbi:MAG: diphthamide synthesis protein [Candidatus Woesearchaeota archaeon]